MLLSSLFGQNKKDIKDNYLNDSFLKKQWHKCTLAFTGKILLQYCSTSNSIILNYK